MNRHTQRHLLALGASLVAALALAACSDPQHASTEVPNELTVSSIQGVAATGYAMQQAPWELVSPNGKRLAQGTTDSVGTFQAQLDTAASKEPQPWMIRVIGKGSAADTLAALLAIDSTDSASHVLFAMVNPITDYVARKLLGPAVNNPTGGYKAPKPDSIGIVGEGIVTNIVGNGIGYGTFSSDRAFRPAIRPNDTNHIPSPTDVILHSLKQRAETDSIPMRELMDSLFAGPAGSAVMAQTDFRLSLASNMAIFRVPPATARPKLEEWQALQGIHGDSTAVAHYQSVWQYQDTAGNGVPPTTGGVDATSLTLESANNAMQGTVMTYSGAELDTALQGFSNGSSIIMGLLQPYAQQLASPSPSERQPTPQQVHDRIMQLGDQLGMVLASLKPSVWTTKPVATTALARRILEEHLQQVAPVPPTREMIAQWVDSTWLNVPEPKFTADPRRTDKLPPALQPTPQPAIPPGSVAPPASSSSADSASVDVGSSSSRLDPSSSSSAS